MLPAGNPSDCDSAPRFLATAQCRKLRRAWRLARGKVIPAARHLLLFSIGANRCRLWSPRRFATQYFQLPQRQFPPGAICFYVLILSGIGGNQCAK